MVLGVLFASTALLSSCRTEQPPEPARLIITPSEYHFGVEGGTVVLTLIAEADYLRYEEFEMGYFPFTTNRNGIIIHRAFNPSAPYWEEFEVEFCYECPLLPRRVVRIRTEWFELKQNEALNQITVTVDPNTSGNVRKVIAGVAPIPLGEGTLVPITQAASSN